MERNDFVDDISITTWKNPTQHPVRLDIYVHEGPKGRRTVVIDPGAEKSLSSDWDDSIRTEHNGVVVGGMAPQLVKKGEERVPIHEAIRTAAELGEKELMLGLHGAKFSPEALIALSRSEEEKAVLARQHEHLKAQVAASAPPAEDPEKAELRRQLEEMKAQMAALQGRTGEVPSEKPEPKNGRGAKTPSTSAVGTSAPEPQRPQPPQ